MPSNWLKDLIPIPTSTVFKIVAPYNETLFLLARSQINPTVVIAITDNRTLVGDTLNAEQQAEEMQNETSCGLWLWDGGQVENTLRLRLLAHVLLHGPTPKHHPLLSKVQPPHRCICFFSIHPHPTLAYGLPRPPAEASSLQLCMTSVFRARFSTYALECRIQNSYKYEISNLEYCEDIKWRTSG